MHQVKHLSATIRNNTNSAATSAARERSGGCSPVTHVGLRPINQKCDDHDELPRHRKPKQGGAKGSQLEKSDQWQGQIHNLKKLKQSPRLIFITKILFMTRIHPTSNTDSVFWAHFLAKAFTFKQR